MAQRLNSGERPMLSMRPTEGAGGFAAISQVPRTEGMKRTATCPHPYTPALRIP